jgi:hypothetical protein
MPMICVLSRYAPAPGATRRKEPVRSILPRASSFPMLSIRTTKPAGDRLLGHPVHQLSVHYLCEQWLPSEHGQHGARSHATETGPKHESSYHETFPLNKDLQ